MLYVHNGKDQSKSVQKFRVSKVFYNVTNISISNECFEFSSIIGINYILKYIKMENSY